MCLPALFTIRVGNIRTCVMDQHTALADEVGMEICDLEVIDGDGFFQAISPEADRLPKTQFYCLMEQVFAMPEVRRLVQQAQEEG